jgi:hypothetical protein
VIGNTLLTGHTTANVLDVRNGRLRRGAMLALSAPTRPASGRVPDHSQETAGRPLFSPRKNENPAGFGPVRRGLTCSDALRGVASLSVRMSRKTQGEYVSHSARLCGCIRSLLQPATQLLCSRSGWHMRRGCACRRAFRNQ